MFSQLGIQTIMDSRGDISLCLDWDFAKSFYFEYVNDALPRDSAVPLSVDEVIACLRMRWKATYDLQLVARNSRLYLQVMWAYLEQQSFPLDEEDYRGRLSEVLDVVNRLSLSEPVREWLLTTTKKPRLGKAISFELKAELGIEEFVL